VRAGRPRRPYRIAFFVQQVLGHVTHSAGLERALREDPDIDVVWVPITYRKEGGWIERLPAVPSGIKGVLRAAADVRRVLTTEKVDGIFFNSPALATSAMRWLRRLPTVISLDITPRQYDREGVHFGHQPDGSGPVANWKHRWNRDIFGNCSALLPWSNWVRDSLEHEYSVDPSVIEVIPPGVDLEAWAPRSIPRHDLPQILFVGGHFQRKGGDLLLEWFRARGRGRCELQIVSSDPAAAVLEAPEIHVHRHLRPNDPKLRQLYWESDLFVLPSRSEPFGIACIEALAAGLPIVVTAVGGLTETVDPGHDGLLVPPGDAKALGAALESLLESPQRRHAMGRHGIRVARERYDAGSNYRRLLAVVKRSVDERRKSESGLTVGVSVR
jgi:glycosyltransferase involved in cell wall biosynthesis